MNGQPYLDTIYSAGGDDGWNWNRGKYTIDTRSLREVVDQLVKEAQSIEASQRVKSAAYSILKSQLAAANRKNTCVSSPAYCPCGIDEGAGETYRCALWRRW